MSSIEPLTLVGVAVALAMDAFAVALATGAGLGRAGPRQYFRLAWHFGLFQALMPVIGWACGLTVRYWVEHYAHWVAFGLLMFVAQGMFRSAFSDSGHTRAVKDPTRGLSLVLLSVATSIDALAVGFSLSVLKVTIWIPALIIGVVAGAFTACGIYLGALFGRTVLGRWAELAGALILVAIGIKIVWSAHGFQW